MAREVPAGDAGKRPPALPFQTPATVRPDRTRHVWVEDADGAHKCVLCGGVVRAGGTRRPSDHAECDAYEPLTQAERDLCQFKV